MAVLYLTWIIDTPHAYYLQGSRPYFSIITINEVHLLNNVRLML